MKNTAILSTLLILFLFSSCKKDPAFDEPTAPQTMEELTVPSSFDWKTTKELSLTLSAATSGIVEVTNIQTVAYQKAFLNPGTAYTMKLTVPSYEKSIKIRFLGQEATLEINGSNLEYTFN